MLQLPSHHTPVSSHENLRSRDLGSLTSYNHFLTGCAGLSSQVSPWGRSTIDAILALRLLSEIHQQQSFKCGIPRHQSCFRLRGSSCTVEGTTQQKYPRRAHRFNSCSSLKYWGSNSCREKQICTPCNDIGCPSRLHPCPSTFLCCSRLDTEPYDCEAQHQHTQLITQ